MARYQDKYPESSIAVQADNIRNTIKRFDEATLSAAYSIRDAEMRLVEATLIQADADAIWDAACAVAPHAPGIITLLAFARLDLASVDPVSCLEGLKGQLSARPDNLAAVHPVRLATAAGAEPSDDVGAGADLMDMDPIEFEDLVAALFKAMGMEVMTTARSGDGGVDVQAMDPDPVRGGKLVIQVKRHRNTIAPAHVRDLYGTMLHEGATKGIFVTTAEFGPSAQEFADGKPLTLIGGRQLADLLARYGIS